MKIEQLEALRKAWYQRTDVLYQIIEKSKYRETTFIRVGVAHRCIKANAMRYMVSNFNRYHFLKEEFNLYHSLAHYPDLPMFSFNRFDKKPEMEKFNKEYINYMTGFDLMIDIDNPDLSLAYSSAYKTKEILDRYEIPYWLMFSGNKGFHFRVDYEDFPKEIKGLGFVSIAKLFKEFAERLKFIENIPDIDLSVFDLRRVAKTPYSVVYPFYFIARPLSDEQFKDFKLIDCTIKHMMRGESISDMRMNGVKKRTGKIGGIKQMFDYYMENGTN